MLAHDLRRICSDPDTAARYFAVAHIKEIEDNEFNLNVPRYVDIFDQAESVPLAEAIQKLGDAQDSRRIAEEAVASVLREFSDAPTV
jgi:type I restriction enzyme M protein